MGPYTRAEELLAYTPVQTDTIPYEFTPFNFEGPTYQVVPDFTVQFINLIGSTAATILAMFDAIGFLPILVVLLLAGAALWWLYHYVTDQVRSDTLQLSNTLQTLGDATGEESLQQAGKVAKKIARAGKQFKGNPFR